jgi:hypothetical protein
VEVPLTEEEMLQSIGIPVGAAKPLSSSHRSAAKQQAATARKRPPSDPPRPSSMAGATLQVTGAFRMTSEQVVNARRAADGLKPRSTVYSVDALRGIMLSMKQRRDLPRTTEYCASVDEGFRVMPWALVPTSSPCLPQSSEDWFEEVFAEATPRDFKAHDLVNRHRRDGDWDVEGIVPGEGGFFENGGFAVGSSSVSVAQMLEMGDELTEDTLEVGGAGDLRAREKARRAMFEKERLAMRAKLQKYQHPAEDDGSEEEVPLEQPGKGGSLALLEQMGIRVMGSAPASDAAPSVAPVSSGPVDLAVLDPAIAASSTPPPSAGVWDSIEVGDADTKGTFHGSEAFNESEGSASASGWGQVTPDEVRDPSWAKMPTVQPSEPESGRDLLRSKIRGETLTTAATTAASPSTPNILQAMFAQARAAAASNATPTAPATGAMPPPPRGIPMHGGMPYPVYPPGAMPYPPHAWSGGTSYGGVPPHMMYPRPVAGPYVQAMSGPPPASMPVMSGPPPASMPASSNAVSMLLAKTNAAMGRPVAAMPASAVVARTRRMNPTE